MGNFNNLIAFRIPKNGLQESELKYLQHLKSSCESYSNECFQIFRLGLHQSLENNKGISIPVDISEEDIVWLQDESNRQLLHSLIKMLSQHKVLLSSELSPVANELLEVATTPLQSTKMSNQQSPQEDRREFPSELRAFLNSMTNS